MLSRMLGGLGRTLITAGTLILLFVVYQLWGTGLQEAASQRELDREFAAAQAEASALLASMSTTTTSTAPPEQEPTPTTTPGQLEVVDAPLAPAGLLPEHGQALGTIAIPSIGVKRQMVSGVDYDQLKRGPGHYEESPLPGQAGNVAIAGHRTTYGQPFHNLDRVEIGDQILFETALGDFVYEIDDKFIVMPDEVHILEEKGDNRVTLIACEPKYSAAKRLIVTAQLVGSPAPEIEGQADLRAEVAESRSGDDPFAEAPSIDGGLAGRTTDKTPAILWGLICAGIWLATWGVQVLLRRRFRHAATTRAAGGGTGDPAAAPVPVLAGAAWPAVSASASTSGEVDDLPVFIAADQPLPGPAVPVPPVAGTAAAGRVQLGRKQRLLTWTPYLVGFPAFMVALYVFFENFGRLLPGNY